MPSDPAQQVNTLRDKIRTGDRGSQADRGALLEFSDTLFLLQSEYTHYRHDKLLRHCTRISEYAPGNLSDALTDREATEAIIAWINGTYDNPETNRDYRTALRVFGKRVTDDDGLPESIKWVPTGTPSSYDPAPNPADMLRWDSDVKLLIEAAANPRDAAMVAVAFDSGARSDELQEITVGDITESNVGLRLYVDGKTGERSVTLVPSEPYVSRGLESHPASTDRSAPLWSKLITAEPLGYRRFNYENDNTADVLGAEPQTREVTVSKSRTRTNSTH